MISRKYKFDNPVVSVDARAFSGNGQVLIPNTVKVLTNIEKSPISFITPQGSINTSKNEIPKNEIWYKADEVIDRSASGVQESTEDNEYGCKTHVFYEDVNTVSADLFYMSQVEDVLLPEGVESIQNRAFCYCTALNTVSIPNTVKSIGYQAFYDSGLRSVDIPDGVQTIGIEAFSNCSCIDSLYLGKGIQSIGDRAFSGCVGISKIVVSDENPIYDSRNNCNAVIETASNSLILGCFNTYIPDGVGSIKNGAFVGSVEAIGIPSSVKTIDDDAFPYESLYTVILDSNAIANRTYNRNFNLVSIFKNGVREYTIGEHVKGIGRYALAGSNVQTVNISEGVANIGEYAFADCRSLSSVSLPSSLLTIDNSTFAFCNLSEIRLGNNISSIGPSAFIGCPITSIDIPYGVETIDEGTFQGTAIQSITIPDSVTNIQYKAFGECPSLKEVSIGENVAYISDDAFNSSYSITSVIWNAKNCEESNRRETYFRDSAANITSFVFGDKVQTIPDYICQSVYNIDSIIIPESVTSIGTYAFSGVVGIPVVTIPKNVKKIGESAFMSCYNLSNIFCNAVTPPSASGMIHHMQDTVTLHVPAESVEAYKNTYPWSDFGNIVPSKYNLYAKTNGGGKINVTFLSQDANLTPTYQVEAVPNNGMVFKEWSDGNTDQRREITLHENTTCEAIFELNPTHCILYTSSDGQIITPRSYDFGAYIVSNIYNNSVGVITFSGPVLKIGDAFENCPTLTSITIPKSVTYVSSFDGCTSLTSVIWNAINCEFAVPSHLFASFYEVGPQITSIVIGKQVQNLPRYFFCKMSNLTSIVFPDTMTDLSSMAGINWLTNLEHLEILGQVQDIPYAFSGQLEKIKVIILGATVPPTLTLVSIPKDIPLCVIPDGTLQAYQNSAWSQNVREFKEISVYEQEKSKFIQ